MKAKQIIGFTATHGLENANKGPGGCGRPNIMEFEYVADSGC